MIRQLPNLTVPAVGTVADVAGPIYGFRVALPSGALGYPAIGPDVVAVTMIDAHGAADAPIVVDPTEDGWFTFDPPLDGLRLNAVGASAVSCDLWIMNGKRDKAPQVVEPRRWRRIVNGLTVGGGAAIDTGILYVGHATRLYLYAFNNSLATTRDLSMTLYDRDGVAGIASVIIPAHPLNSTRVVYLAPESTVANSTTAQVYPVPPRIRFTVPAAGADTYQIVNISAS